MKPAPFAHQAPASLEAAWQPFARHGLRRRDGGEAE
jgi:hypothetical protein